MEGAQSKTSGNGVVVHTVQTHDLRSRLSVASIHSGDGGIKIVLREAGGRRSAGCGHDWLPSFNGMSLSKTSTTDAEHITDTHGVLVARAPRVGSGMATGATPGSTHPWHLMSHVCAARHSLRRALLWPAAASFECSARR